MKNLEIDYSEDSITHCKNGWYYKNRKLSIISQVIFEFNLI